LRTCTAYLANVLNPKAAAVYLTVAPQFLDSTTRSALCN
jgi:threonine/homoserine/homoserine lactone efflux protein